MPPRRPGVPQPHSSSARWGCWGGDAEAPTSLATGWSTPDARGSVSALGLPSAPALSSLWLPFFLFLLQALSVPLYVCVSVSYHSGCVCSPSAALHPALSLCICFSVSLLYLSLLTSTSLYLSVSLFTNHCVSQFLSLSLCPLFPFPSSIPILWLAASGGCSKSIGTAWGNLGALPRVLFPVTYTCRHLGAASFFPV